MPIDYSIPAKIGSIRTGMIDQMTLANLREQVESRKMQRAQAEQQNALRQLLPQTVTPDGQINQNAFSAFMQGGGDPRDVAALRQSVIGPQAAAQWTTPKVVRDVVRDGKPGQIVLTPEGERFEPYPGEKPKPQAAPKPPPIPKPTPQETTRFKQSEQAQAALGTMQSAYDVLDQYERLLDEKGPSIMDPELDAAYTALTLEMKNVAGLGALAGPDLGLLQGMITPPTSLKGQAFGKDGLKKQIALIRQRMDAARGRVQKMVIAPGELTIGAGSVGGATPTPAPSSGGNSKYPSLDKMLPGFN